MIHIVVLLGLNMYNSTHSYLFICRRNAQVTYVHRELTISVFEIFLWKKIDNYYIEKHYPKILGQ